VAEKQKSGGGKAPQPPAKTGKAPATTSTRGTVAPKGQLAEKKAGPAPKVEVRLKNKYRDEVIPGLMKEFNYTNAMQVPKVEKVVVNLGLGEAIANAKALDAAVGDLTAIVGQRPVINRAKKSIAAFKLRTGMPIGVSVTLRGNKMYEFLDRLMNVSLPRVRDFTGVPTKAFDGHGNYTLGLKEQIIFPEIDYDRVDKVRGMEVTIVTSAKTDEQGQKLLRLLGMPFRK